MVSSKEDALEFFKNTNGKTQFNKDELQVSIELLQKIASEEGLTENESDEIVKFLTMTKLSAQVCMNLLSCLIPKTKISNDNLEEVLLWFFSELGNGRISHMSGKKFLQWLTGITYYELADVSVVESYYYSFIFLLSKPYLESTVCTLLCLISKPEDAKRWVVQQVLNIQNNSSPKPHTNALLSLLKSYRANMVPERIPVTNFHYKATPFDEALKKAHDRKIKESAQNANESNSSIKWNILDLYDEKSKKFSKLIPSANSLSNDLQDKLTGKKLHCIYEFKTYVNSKKRMASLGVRPFSVQCPSETLSLLANLVGYHVLAFSDFVTKTQFFHKLQYTMHRVYILELEPYSEKEKIFFLNSLKELQEYTQQSIPVITAFLHSYLPIWDGEESQEQILGLLEWIEVHDEEILETYIFTPLRQIFISSGTYFKCLILKTMGKLMRNLLIMDKKEHNCFRSYFQDSNVIKCIEAINSFVGLLISNGLIWNNDKNSRSIMNAALDFYEIAQAVEQAGDLPLIMVMPPTLVYSCLFSGSRVCTARLCSLLVHLQMISVERLYFLGVFQDFAVEVKKLNVYTLDFYRCLWSKLSFQEDQESFIFQHEIFGDKFWKVKEMYGDVIDRIFGIEYNTSFWDPKAKGLREVVMCQLAEDYPSIVQLKKITEERLLQFSDVETS